MTKTCELIWKIFNETFIKHCYIKRIYKYTSKLLEITYVLEYFT
jgi:hypothetical protein